MRFACPNGGADEAIEPATGQVTCSARINFQLPRLSEMTGVLMNRFRWLAASLSGKGASGTERAQCRKP